MQELFHFDKPILDAAAKAMANSRAQFEEIDRVTEYNQCRMLKAFIDQGVSESHFTASTGYGYGDRGREVIDAVFAQAVGAEDALVRHNFVSGTHTLTVALFGVLRPGDTMLSVTGLPYDTLHGTIGLGSSTNGTGTLRDFGIRYDQVELTADGRPDLTAIERAVQPGLRMAYIQRSRGYSLRPSLRVEEIAEIVRVVHKKAPDCVIMVDNCYGEFVQEQEPVSVGADLIAGSLIKNPGGGIAPTGGYIAGRHDLVELCAGRLTTPGLGRELGATLGHSRELFMGIFNAPHVTGEALKTAVFAAELFASFGYRVTPEPGEARGDIIQAVVLENAPGLIAFCKGMQQGAPVDSFVTPEPWDMPGYDSQVIMAAGAFTNGASVELSADGPLREPFAAWMQGGLNFHSAKTGVMLAAQSMLAAGTLKNV